MKFPPYIKNIQKHLTWKNLRLVGLTLFLLLAGFTLYLDFRVRDAFEGRRFALPARLYARPLELFPGLKLTPATLAAELNRLGYKEGLKEDEPGRFERQGNRFEIATRPFVFWDGAQPARRLSLEFHDDAIRTLRDALNKPDPTLVRLDPLYIGGIYPAHNEDRLLIKLDEVPEHLVQALIAIEDRKFYKHHGIHPRAMARAVVALVSGQGVQGGSTLTQQLVKNFFLSSDRTLRRKGTEILMALLLELHYDKRDILETYLNEIYLGQDGNRAIHGVGLASQFYFGKSLKELTLPEAALLVGIIKGPSYYDPHRHPQRARERRNLVLTEMAKFNPVAPEVLSAAIEAPLGITDKPVMGTTPYPAFLDLVRRQLRSDYREEDLRSEGLHIITTLDPVVQTSAEQALTKRLAQHERARKQEEGGLEGAVVVTNTQSGEVQALVGGRDPRFEGLNRALDAHRPVGSLLKPVIYLSALMQPRRYTLITPLDDSPLVWKEKGIPDWKPQNYDKTSHGKVPLHLALAHSYNVASARLGLDVGVNEVINNVRRLGIERELPPYAATLLGAVELAPIDITQMYQTIASGGFRTPLRAIREIVTAGGHPVQRFSLAVEPAFDPAPVYLLTRAMQDVVSLGTATGLKEYLPPSLKLAGKTGTTDELRDAWFAGFSGDRLAVVWVGYDDNRPAGLTGASGALPVWGELMRKLDLEPLQPPLPEEIENVWIDPTAGLRADRDCKGAIELPFLHGSAPEETAPCARSPGKKFKSWLRRLFD